MSDPVLIVDDSKLARKLLRRALPPEWDVEVSEACNGVEALQAFREGRAGVMFLDLTMPELDGFGVLEALHEEEANAVVFVVSADIQPQALERVKALGAIEFIKKPVTPEALRAVIARVGLL